MIKPGRPIQNAFVVRDLDQALGHWLSMGVGPFYRRDHAAYVSAHYHGKPIQPDYSIALAYWGDMQIELIAQNCQTPSVYREFLDEGHEGFHHNLVIVPDLEAFRRAIPDTPYELLSEVSLGPGTGVFYLRGKEYRWPLVEVGHLDPAVFDFFDTMKRASENWDGSNPIRPI